MLPYIKTTWQSAMAGEDFKLLGFWVSPFMIRVRIALHLKGLRYEYVEEDLWNHKSELLLKSNPAYGKVPVLIHDGKPICESMVIVQYIDEAFAGTGPSFLPSDPYERAIARFWTAYVDDKLYKTWIEILKGKTEEQRAGALEQTIAAVETLEEAFKECSKGKDFFSGDTIGYVDIALGSFLYVFEEIGRMTGKKLIDAARTPLLAAWVERFSATSTVKELMPEGDRVLEYLKMLMVKYGAAPSQ